MVNMIKVKHKSNLNALKKSIELLGKSRVYVGIPAENASRDNGNDINNAELLYIQTHGVRKKSMREEMQLALNEGKAYSKAYEMYIKSHGSPLWHIPPRPVIEPAINNNKKEIAERLITAYGKAMENIYAGDSMQTAMQHLEAVGMYAQNIVRAWFTNPNNGWASNSPLTIAKKGSSNPLIDTGEMRKSITYVVKSDE